MSKVSIHIYTVDFTKKEDDFYIGISTMFTNRNAAQKHADEMNALHKKNHPDEDDWEYRVHQHIAFKTW